MRLAVSNPPFNLSWEPPPFVEADPRFEVVPPKSNANWGFVQLALAKGDEAVLILPNSVLTPSNKSEARAVKWAVEEQKLKAVVACPDSMFESTSIATCLLFLSKAPQPVVEFVDMRGKGTPEKRQQRGQFGGNSHTDRIYTKTFNTFSAEQRSFILDAIFEHKNEAGLCAAVTTKVIRENGYNLTPWRYIEAETPVDNRRDIRDIVKEYNECVRFKNSIKLTINKTLAKSLGIDKDAYSQTIDFTETDALVERLTGEKLGRDDYITFTASAVCKFENQDKNRLNPVMALIFNGWKQHVYTCNLRENQLLAELRDALLSKLMSGEVEV